MRQLEILDDRLVFVPLRIDWIGSCQNGSTRVQRTDDPRLGDGKGLLLHHFVKNGPESSHLDYSKLFSRFEVLARALTFQRALRHFDWPLEFGPNKERTLTKVQSFIKI